MSAIHTDQCNSKTWREISDLAPTDCDCGASKVGPPTLQEQMKTLRRQLRELGWAIVDAAGIPKLVEWIDMVIFRWRLKRNVRRHHRQVK